MKDKGTLDVTPEPDLLPPGEPTFMPSVEAEARRTAAWMEQHFGLVEFVNESFHHLRCVAHGVTVRAVLWGESQTVDWMVGWGVRSNRAGGTKFGDNLDRTIPATVQIAAEYVKVMGGCGT
jgi:hypothetical protein